MSTLDIKERQVGNVIVLDMDGKVKIDGSNIVFRDTVRRLLKEGHLEILLNLAGVSYIDSSGLGELVSSHFALGKRGGQIKLLHLTHSLQQLMTITKLLTVFDVYENEAEAVKSFNTQGSKPEQPPVFAKGAHHEAHS